LLPTFPEQRIGSIFEGQPHFMLEDFRFDP